MEGFWCKTSGQAGEEPTRAGRRKRAEGGGRRLAGWRVGGWCLLSSPAQALLLVGGGRGGWVVVASGVSWRNFGQREERA